MKEFDCKEYQFLFDAVEKDELVKKASHEKRADTVNAKRQKDVLIIILLQFLKQIFFFFTNIKLSFVFLALS